MHRRLAFDGEENMKACSCAQEEPAPEDRAPEYRRRGCLIHVVKTISCTAAPWSVRRRGRRRGWSRSPRFFRSRLAGGGRRRPRARPADPPAARALCRCRGRMTAPPANWRILPASDRKAVNGRRRAGGVAASPHAGPGPASSLSGGGQRNIPVFQSVVRLLAACFGDSSFFNANPLRSR